MRTWLGEHCFLPAQCGAHQRMKAKISLFRRTFQEAAVSLPHLTRLSSAPCQVSALPFHLLTHIPQSRTCVGPHVLLAVPPVHNHPPEGETMLGRGLRVLELALGLVELAKNMVRVTRMQICIFRKIDCSV